MKKRLCSVLLCLFLCLPIFVLGVSADGEQYKEGAFTYVLNEDGVTVTGIDDAAGDVVIPAALGGHPVTEIGEEAIKFNYTVTSVTLPESVLRINPWGFVYCTELVNLFVSAPGGAYVSVDGVLYTADQKTLVKYPCGRSSEVFVIPSGVSEIAEQAFKTAESLKRIEIPESVTKIGEGAFGTTSLESVQLPGGVSEIPGMAYMFCDNLRTVSISSNVKTIGYSAFNSCGALTEVVLADGVQKIEWNAFGECDALESIVIPASVTVIEEEAFLGSENLTIKGVAGSYAETFATENSLAFAVYTGQVQTPAPEVEGSQGNVGETPVTPEGEQPQDNVKDETKKEEKDDEDEVSKSTSFFDNDWAIWVVIGGGVLSLALIVAVILLISKSKKKAPALAATAAAAVPVAPATPVAPVAPAVPATPVTPAVVAEPMTVAAPAVPVAPVVPATPVEEASPAPVAEAPTARFCTGCGAQLPPEAAFCANCGQKRSD